MPHNVLSCHKEIFVTDSKLKVSRESCTFVVVTPQQQIRNDEFAYRQSYGTSVS